MKCKLPSQNFKLCSELKNFSLYAFTLIYCTFIHIFSTSYKRSAEIHFFHVSGVIIYVKKCSLDRHINKFSAFVFIKANIRSEKFMIKLKLTRVKKLVKDENIFSNGSNNFYKP